MCPWPIKGTTKNETLENILSSLVSRGTKHKRASENLLDIYKLHLPFFMTETIYFQHMLFWIEIYKYSSGYFIFKTLVYIFMNWIRWQNKKKLSYIIPTGSILWKLTKFINSINCYLKCFHEVIKCLQSVFQSCKIVILKIVDFTGSYYKYQLLSQIAFDFYFRTEYGFP